MYFLRFTVLFCFFCDVMIDTSTNCTAFRRVTSQSTKGYDAYATVKIILTDTSDIRL